MNCEGGIERERERKREREREREVGCVSARWTVGSSV